MSRGMGDRLLTRSLQDGSREIRLPASFPSQEVLWINGVKITADVWNATPSKPWLQIKMDTDPWTIVEQDGPPPDTWGANDRWRLKADLMRYPYVD